ncbi:MAG: transcriptional regulator [Adhaeribacter sp.]|jgi:Fur family ferric uptake transcriptional regulator|nr:transcriptional regulator [Adhaeribacter sp.]
MRRRNTPIKEAILAMLQTTPSALSQDMVAQNLQGVADKVTIYRVLNRFCEDGLAHRIVSDDGKYYFALCLNCADKNHAHNHFHFRCLHCQKVECLAEEVNVNLPSGYKIGNINGWISGYCNTCS